MTFKPTIERGLGALTPAAWKSIVSAVEFVNQNERLLRTMIAAFNSSDSQQSFSFIAKITDSAPMADAGTAPNVWRWKYAWSRVKLLQAENGSGNTKTDIQTYSAGEAGSLSGVLSNATPGTDPPVMASWALNLFEMGNTASLRAGYPTNPANGFVLDADAVDIVDWTVKPIEDNTVVLMTAVRAFNGRMQYVFSHPNAINGVCPENAFAAPGGGGGGEEGGELPI